MKILLYLAALVTLGSAAYEPWERTFAYSEAERNRGTGAGAEVCDRLRLNANDVISQKFMKDHICLIRGTAPGNLEAFCRDFRKGPPVYQVLLLRQDELDQLRSDLTNHQNDFYNDRNMFRPLHSGYGLRHYTTDQPYSFIFCERPRGQSQWIGQLKSGYYQQYIPQGPVRKNERVYKIYHGCRPVQQYPGFFEQGSC